MTWVNPPPVVTQMRNQLVLCSSLSAAPLNMTNANFHYPNANPSGPLADPMPYCTIAEEEASRDRYAEGALPLITGRLVCTLYMGESQYSEVGSLETLGRQVLIDLGSQYFGLNFKNMMVRVASNPSPGQRAAENDTLQSSYRTIVLTFIYGLNRSR